MKRIALLSVLLLLVLMPATAMSTTNITMPILIKDETGSAVAGAKVMVYDSTGAKVAEGTTNSTGYVVLSIPNETVTFWAELASGKYLLNTTDMTTVNTTEVTYIPLDASAMYRASINANATGITAKIKTNLNTKVEVQVDCNSTVYGKESLNITFPSSKVVMPFVELKLVEIKVDATSYTNKTSVTVDLSSANRVVTAGYTKYYTFTWTWETYVIIAFIGLLFVMLLMAMVRGARAIGIRPRKYVSINSA